MYTVTEIIDLSSQITRFSLIYFTHIHLGKTQRKLFGKGKFTHKKKKMSLQVEPLILTLTVQGYLLVTAEPGCLAKILPVSNLCSSFHVKMPFSYDKTAAAAAPTLLSTAAAWLTVSSSSSSVIFQGSFQRSLPAFGMPTGSEMLKPTENAVDQSLARWMCEISHL